MRTCRAGGWLCAYVCVSTCGIHCHSGVCSWEGRATRRRSGGSGADNGGRQVAVAAAAEVAWRQLALPALEAAETASEGLADCACHPSTRPACTQASLMHGVVSHKCCALFSGVVELAGVLTAGDTACEFSTKLQPASESAEPHDGFDSHAG